MKKLFILFASAMCLIAACGISACSCDNTDDRHIHNYTQTVTAPDCQNQGYTTNTCECGRSYKSDYTNALGHDYVDKICTRCGKVEHEHNYVQTVVAPTCTEEGYTRGVCSGCGATYTAYRVAPLGHKYVETVTEPTCTEQGYTTFTCACGDSYIDNYTQPTGHSFVGGVCTQCNTSKVTAGLKYTLSSDGTYYSCSGLGTATETEIIIASEYNGKPVKKINENVFSFCSNLLSVTIPDCVTSIGDYAFYNCRSLTIYCEEKEKPDGWGEKWNYCSSDIIIDYENYSDIKDGWISESIETYCPVVWDCENNEKADDGNIYTVIDGIRYALSDSEAYLPRQSFTISGDKNILQTITHNAKNYRIVTIQNEAFNGCRKLTGITIPDGVGNIGDYAFSNCDGLMEITIPDSVTSIGSHAFADCGNLETVKLGKGLISIGRGAFSSCAKLTDIKIPERVTSIATSISDYLFAYCANLISVTIPRGINYIGKYAFGDCKALKNITFGGTVDEWNKLEKGERWNKGVGDLTINCSDGVTVNKRAVLKYSYNEIGDYYICEGLESTEGVTDVVIDSYVDGKPVRVIAENAFRDCKNVERITLPTSLATIGKYAFGNCVKLKSLELPYVTTIGNYAFYGCENLERIEIQNSVKALESYTFASCPRLKEITFRGTIEQWKAIPHTDWLYFTTDVKVNCIGEPKPMPGSLDND